MRIQLGFSVGLSFALGTGALAEAPEAARLNQSWRLAALFDCRQIISVVERLSCYDAAMGGDGGLGLRRDQPVSAAEGGPLPTAAWRLDHGHDPFSDADLSSVRLWPASSGGDRDGDGLLALSVACTGDGGREISVGVSGYLGVSGQALAVRFRFGAGQITQEIWRVGAIGGELLAPQSSAFSDGLGRDLEVLLEVTSYRDQRIWARYPGRLGGRAALEHVLGGCGAGLVETALAAERPSGL